MVFVFSFLLSFPFFHFPSPHCFAGFHFHVLFVLLFPFSLPMCRSSFPLVTFPGRISRLPCCLFFFSNFHFFFFPPLRFPVVCPRKTCEVFPCRRELRAGLVWGRVNGWVVLWWVSLSQVEKLGPPARCPFSPFLFWLRGFPTLLK